MTPEQRLDRLDSLMSAALIRGNEIDRRAKESHRQAMERMDRAEQKAERDYQRAMKRMEIFDRRLEATRKLVEAGMKMVIQDRTEIRRMQKNWDAYLESLKHPRNGNGRH